MSAECQNIDCPWNNFEMFGTKTCQGVLTLGTEEAYLKDNSLWAVLASNKGMSIKDMKMSHRKFTVRNLEAGLSNCGRYDYALRNAIAKFKKSS